MIFAKTLSMVLSGRKTQTTRLARTGDHLGKTTGGYEAVYDVNNRPRWIVGNTYAVQPERCHHARGRIRVTSLRYVPDPTAVDESFARAEGFDTLEEFFRVWTELHPRNLVQRCWAIGFANRSCNPRLQ